MLAITHTLISLPFALLFDNPVLIVVSAFIFHLFADTLLHWNLYPDQSGKYFYPLVAVDVVVALLLYWVIVGDRSFSLPFLLAIFGGNLPDILHVSWDILGTNFQNRYLAWAKPWFRFHDRLQLETPNIFHGLITQVVLVTLSLLILGTSA